MTRSGVLARRFFGGGGPTIARDRNASEPRVTDLLFLDGLIFGLLLAAPVGPVAVLCVQRTIAEGRLHGLLSGLGAAIGDALYGAVAAFGISAVEDWIEGHQTDLRIVGGIVLLLLALRTVAWTKKTKGRKSAAPDKSGPIVTHSLVKDFISTFMLAVTNPITLLTFAGLFAMLGITEAGASVGNASILVGGVFLGSAMWWLAIAAVADRFRSFVDGSYQHWMDRISALILAGFGVYSILAGFGVFAQASTFF